MVEVVEEAMKVKIVSENLRCMNTQREEKKIGKKEEGDKMYEYGESMREEEEDEKRNKTCVRWRRRKKEMQKRRE